MRTVPVFRIDQPLGEFYVAVLPADFLLQITYSDPLKLISMSGDGRYGLRGHQRKLVQQRLNAIGRYIDTVESAFPNSIILAANYKETGELVDDESLMWSVEFEKDSPVGLLKIPTLARLAAVVDGQHRLYGFTESEVRSRQSMPLLCAIYLDLPNPFQAFLFATINYNQRPVDKSQSYELYGFNLDEELPQAWSPEKAAVHFCRRLNTDNLSPFTGHIIVAAQADAALLLASKKLLKEWAVSTATIVEGCLTLFSSNPKRDRDEMHKYGVEDGRVRSVLSKTNDNSPLRNHYLDNNDQLIYKVVLNFFIAASEVLWKNGDPGFVRKTVGVQALFGVLKLLCVDALNAKNISVEYFKEKLAPSARINFNDNFFYASGGGKTRIRNVLELALGLRSLNDVPVDNKAAYSRVARLDLTCPHVEERSYE